MPRLETIECDCELCSSPTQPAATVRPRPPTVTFRGREINPFAMTYEEVQSMIRGDDIPPSRYTPLDTTGRNDDRWYVPPEKGSEE